MIKQINTDKQKLYFFQEYSNQFKELSKKIKKFAGIISENAKNQDKKLNTSFNSDKNDDSFEKILTADFNICDSFYLEKQTQITKTDPLFQAYYKNSLKTMQHQLHEDVQRNMRIFVGEKLIQAGINENETWNNVCQALKNFSPTTKDEVFQRILPLLQQGFHSDPMSVFAAPQKLQNPEQKNFTPRFTLYFGPFLELSEPRASVPDIKIEESPEKFTISASCLRVPITDTDKEGIPDEQLVGHISYSVRVDIYKENSEYDIIEVNWDNWKPL